MIPRDRAYGYSSEGSRDGDAYFCLVVFPSTPDQAHPIAMVNINVIS